MTDRSRSCHNQDHESCSGRYAVGRDSRNQLIEYMCRCWCHNEPPVTDRPRPYIKVSRYEAADDVIERAFALQIGGWMEQGYRAGASGFIVGAEELAELRAQIDELLDSNHYSSEET